MNDMDSKNVCYSTTPIRNDSSVPGVSTKRPTFDRSSVNPYKTPVRAKIHGGICRTRTNIIETMPIYSPPTKNLNFIKNPFEHARFLKERLSQPICSPSLFQDIVSPSKADNFTWSIEDISILRPAQIDENPCQDYDSWYSPTTENAAQEAINKFFSNQTIMVSPIAKDKKKKIDNDGKTSVSKGTQTALSLPPNLPAEVELVLRKYQFTNSQPDEDLDTSSGSVSRKKLMFDNIEQCPDESSNSCESPLHMEVKCVRQDAASTPVTKHPASPGWSPIVIDSHCDSVLSPMLVDTSQLNKTALCFGVDASSLDKDNICSTPRRIPDSEYDSAFSSM